MDCDWLSTVPIVGIAADQQPSTIAHHRPVGSAFRELHSSPTSSHLGCELLVN